MKTRKEIRADIKADQEKTKAFLQKAQHTPTPWEVNAFSVRPANKIEDQSYIVIPSPQQHDAEKILANAEFIVRAVNSHESLLDALIMALPFVESELDNDGYKKGAVAKVIKQVLDAIEQAEEPEGGR